ncbi:MAG: Gfo/Idh/MocA family oxidoreductase [Armatimonadetes bacterium]|nr:Gfo/Idh/MocA family oxidoreductase [Armatimonadota bacterium]
MSIGPLRLLIVGLGQRGQQWLEFCHRYAPVEVVAGVDPDPTARNLARTYLPGPECRLFPSLRFALRAIEVDAAIVCTPLPDHATTTLACLEAGLPVLVEKPFTPTVAEARGLVQAAERTGLVLMVGQSYRHTPAELVLREALQSGLIGEPGFVQCVSHRHRRAQGTYQARVTFAQMDMAVHHLDALRVLLGSEAVTVTARVFNPPWSGYRHGGAVEALIEMANGVHVTYVGSLVSQTNAFSQRIEGAAGALVADGRSAEHHATGSSPRVLFAENPGAPGWVRPAFIGMEALLADLTAAIREGREPPTSGRDNLQTLAMALACLLSSDEERVVAVSEVLSA